MITVSLFWLLVLVLMSGILGFLAGSFRQKAMDDKMYTIGVIYGIEITSDAYLVWMKENNIVISDSDYDDNDNTSQDNQDKPIKMGFDTTQKGETK